MIIHESITFDDDGISRNPTSLKLESDKFMVHEKYLTKFSLIFRVKETDFIENSSLDHSTDLGTSNSPSNQCIAREKEIEFESRIFRNNLNLVDSNLPSIVAEIGRIVVDNGGTIAFKEAVNILTTENPLGFNLTNNHPFYEYKVKNFLTEVALGMTPEKVWTGKYYATGSIIIVKENGDVVCCHIYNRNEFQEYLLNNTKLEQASTGEDEHNPGSAKEADSKKYRYGWLYEEDGQLFLKLNLQIRFT